MSTYTGYNNRASTATLQVVSCSDTSCTFGHVSRDGEVVDLSDFHHFIDVATDRVEARERSKRGWREEMPVRAVPQVSDRRISLAPLPRSSC